VSGDGDNDRQIVRAADPDSDLFAPVMVMRSAPKEVWIAMDDAPLILTLWLDQDSSARFDAERRCHFPPGRNLVPAHVTMFHHLPGDHCREIAQEMTSIARRTGQIKLSVPSLRFLGNGVAYDVLGSELVHLRAVIAQRWSAHLTRQDAQGFRPHVTIQNNVGADIAKALYERLSKAFEPFDVTGMGLQLWRYRGGPWEAAGEYAFER